MTVSVIAAKEVNCRSDRVNLYAERRERVIIRTIDGAFVGDGPVSATYRLLRFGVFELNLDLEELRKNGTPLKLPPQPFHLLAMLASRSGQIVSRDEIQQQLWGSDTFIDFEQGVNKCVKQIRTALGDNPDNPLYLETIPRHGYRFLAPVRTKIVPAPPPQVKEASSGLLANVVGQVRERVESTTQSVPATIPKADPGSASVRSRQPSSSKPIPARQPRSRLLWALVPITLLLAGAVYWLLRWAAR